MTTTTSPAPARRPYRKSAPVSRFRDSVCRCGTVACALVTVVLLVPLLPVLALAYLAAWMDRFDSVATTAGQPFVTPHRPR